VISAQEHGKHKRREGVGNEKRRELEVEGSCCGLAQQNFDDGQLREQRSQHKAEARILPKCLGMVDPELRNSRGKNEQAEQELFGGFILLARENQGGEAEDESGEQNGTNRPAILKGSEKIALFDLTTTLAG
jgi:hypothetical protein